MPRPDPSVATPFISCSHGSDHLVHLDHEPVLHLPAASHPDQPPRLPHPGLLPRPPPDSDRTVAKFKQLLDGPLVKTVQVHGKDDFELSEDCLSLLDPEKARDWARSYEYVDGEIMDGGSVKVIAQLLDVTKNEFFCSFIDRVEKNPPGLEAYREKRDEEDNPIPGAAPLGGWSGRLKLTATALYRGLRCQVEVVRDVKVIDISPPAPDHTLFIHGKKTEYIKAGTFVLSNLTLPRQVTDLIHDLTMKINQILKVPGISREQGGCSPQRGAHHRKVGDGGGGSGQRRFHEVDLRADPARGRGGRR